MAVEAPEENVTAPRKRGRPRKHPVEPENRVERPLRVPVGAPREILTVFGRDPNYVYRWVKDAGDRGHRIMRFKQGGYELVEASEITVGQNLVHQTEDKASVVRYAAGPSEPDVYLYLMKIRTEFYNEDQKAKEGQLQEVENSIFRERDSDRDDGQY